MHVVVWDPSGEYWEGGLVDDATAAVLRARDVATLPIDPGLVRGGAVRGYFRRSTPSTGARAWSRRTRRRSGPTSRTATA